jgi:hypothetical protein
MATRFPSLRDVAATAALSKLPRQRQVADRSCATQLLYSHKPKGNGAEQGTDDPEQNVGGEHGVKPSY